MPPYCHASLPISSDVRKTVFRLHMVHLSVTSIFSSFIPLSVSKSFVYSPQDLFCSDLYSSNHLFIIYSSAKLIFFPEYRQQPACLPENSTIPIEGPIAATISSGFVSDTQVLHSFNCCFCNSRLLFLSSRNEK